MSFRSSKRRLQQLLLTIACLGALAGCGDDDGEDSPPPASESSEAAEPSPLRERLDRLITDLLADRGLDAGVAQCAVAELAETVSDEQLESAIAEIRKTGAAPPGVIEAAAAAGKTCGRN